MSKSQYRLCVVILLLVTNLTTASVVYGLLYSVPAAAQVSSSPAKGEQDLPKPELVIPAQPELSVAAPRDPIKVLDPDAAYSNLQIEVQKLKSNWILSGIAMFGKKVVSVKIVDTDAPNGERIVQGELEAWACFFAGNERFYREGDRLEGTPFTVKSIHFDTDGAFVEVEYDLGARVRLYMKTK
jgi:hypothetical protein